MPIELGLKDPVDLDLLLLSHLLIIFRRLVTHQHSNLDHYHHASYYF